MENEEIAHDWQFLLFPTIFSSLLYNNTFIQRVFQYFQKFNLDVSKFEYHRFDVRGKWFILETDVITDEEIDNVVPFANPPCSSETCS